MVKLYHGTKAHFTFFQPDFIADIDEPGFFFFEHEENSREYAGENGYILEVELTATVVLEQTSLMWHRGEGLSPAEAFKSGYEAIRVSDFEGSTMWVVQDADLLKIINTTQVEADMAIEL